MKRISWLDRCGRIRKPPLTLPSSLHYSTASLRLFVCHPRFHGTPLRHHHFTPWLKVFECFLFTPFRVSGGHKYAARSTTTVPTLNEVQSRSFDICHIVMRVCIPTSRSIPVGFRAPFRDSCWARCLVSRLPKPSHGNSFPLSLTASRSVGTFSRRSRHPPRAPARTPRGAHIGLTHLSPFGPPPAVPFPFFPFRSPCIFVPCLYVCTVYDDWYPDASGCH